MTDTPATAADLAAVRRAAMVRVDYLRWLARGLDNRSRLALGERYGANDAALDREAAHELRQLVQSITETA